MIFTLRGTGLSIDQGVVKYFYDSPVDMYCHVYGVRCTVFVSANELVAQTSRVSGERANEYPVSSFQH